MSPYIPKCLQIKNRMAGICFQNGLGWGGGVEGQARPQGSGSMRFITLFLPLLCMFKLSRIKALKIGEQQDFTE